MKTAIVLALVVSVTTGILVQAPVSLASEKVDAKTRSELIAARETVWRAWFAGDSTVLARSIPGVVAAGSPWGCDDRSAVLQEAHRSAARGKRLVGIDFDSTTIHLRGSVAIVQARFRYEVEDSNRKRSVVRGVATEIFVREKGRWVNPFWYLE
jgi:hypothetical protein